MSYWFKKLDLIDVFVVWLSRLALSRNWAHSTRISFFCISLFYFLAFRKVVNFWWPPTLLLPLTLNGIKLIDLWTNDLNTNDFCHNWILGKYRYENIKARKRDYQKNHQIDISCIYTLYIINSCLSMFYAKAFKSNIKQNIGWTIKWWFLLIDYVHGPIYK